MASLSASDPFDPDGLLPVLSEFCDDELSLFWEFCELPAPGEFDELPAI